jgi:hypothetical protein
MAIPGVTTIIKDRFYTVSRQDAPAGPRIVAIARRSTADGTGDVSDLDVVRATNEADVITAFGDGSDLHRAFIELVTAGAERIFLVPLPSNTSFNHTTGAVTSGGSDVFASAMNAAEAAVPDIIVPWGRGASPSEWAATPTTPEIGFHADNSATVANNWAYKVAAAVKSISENTNPCIAVMGVKPYASASEKMIPSQISSHLALATLPDNSITTSFTDYLGNSVSTKDVGPYVTIVASEIKPVNYTSGSTSFGYSNGAAFLAATMSRLPSYSSVVNKPLYNVEAIRYAPTRTQQGSLGDKGINSVVINFNKVPVFGEGLTFAQLTSDYTRLSTKRIVDEATLVVRQVCQKFVGQPSTIEIRNSMETAITSGLRGMQLLGALLGSDFSVSYIPSQNKAVVDLVLTPAFELKTIEVQVAISI